MWLDFSLSLSRSDDDDGGRFRSTESLGDLVGGVDADDVRSLDDPLFD